MFTDFIYPSKLKTKFRAAYVVGEIILVADFAWWLSWISLMALSLTRGELNDSTAGFNALACPHTAIIPTIFAILHDFYTNCTTEVCTVSTPAFTWYVFPALIIPYDALALSYNALYYGQHHWTFGLSIYTVIVSCFTALWSFSSYWSIIAERSSQGALQPLKETR
jgi:hypothetical protein